MNQVWIFLTVGFGLSLLLLVVIITMVLCCLVHVYQRREEKYKHPNYCPDMNMIIVAGVDYQAWQVTLLS